MLQRSTPANFHNLSARLAHYYLLTDMQVSYRGPNPPCVSPLLQEQAQYREDYPAGTYGQQR